MTFQQWLDKVDNFVWAKAGCSLHDLPDCPLRDWFDRKVSPKSAASRAIRRAKTW